MRSPRQKSFHGSTQGISPKIAFSVEMLQRTQRPMAKKALDKIILSAEILKDKDMLLKIHGIDFAAAVP